MSSLIQRYVALVRISVKYAFRFTILDELYSLRNSYYSWDDLKEKNGKKRKGRSPWTLILCYKVVLHICVSPSGQTEVHLTREVWL